MTNIYDVSIKNDKRDQNEQLRLAIQQRAEQDFRAVISIVEGRRFIERLIADAGVYNSTFTDNALTTAYQEGRRTVGLWILEQFTAHPDLYVQHLTDKLHD